MTYEELEAEISAVPKFGADASLANLSEYLKMIGNPEDSLRVIHVAGTNGKGSVCAFMESILRRAGYRTGLFTSPHLIRMNERFRINFIPVADEEMFRAWEIVKGLLEEGKKQNLNPLTWFEIIFVMGLLIFQNHEIDYCIMETGLGGRLDATALLKPILSVITSISLDHTAILGETISQIAGEKAGIIKPGIPVAALDENNGAFSILLEECKQKHTYIEKVSYDNITILKKRKNKIDFSLNTSYYRYESLTVSGQADYQVYNAALAVCALRILFPELALEAVRDGLLHMRWEGRMEEIRPGVFLDGAHNPGAIARICQSIKQDQTPWSLLFAVCSDKDYSDMIRMLAEIPWIRIYITRLEGSRSASVHEVADCFGRYTDTDFYCFPNTEEAFSLALGNKGKEEKLLCLGSLYLVGELKKLAGSMTKCEKKERIYS